MVCGPSIGTENYDCKRAFISPWVLGGDWPQAVSERGNPQNRPNPDRTQDLRLRAQGKSARPLPPHYGRCQRTPGHHHHPRPCPPLDWKTSKGSSTLWSRLRRAKNRSRRNELWREGRQAKAWSPTLSWRGLTCVGVQALACPGVHNEQTRRTGVGRTSSTSPHFLRHWPLGGPATQQ